MSNYTPDGWVIIKIKGTDPHYRVFGSWRGGYLNGDSWRLNSGIVRAEQNGDTFDLFGHSGSIYTVHKEGYGRLGMYNRGEAERLCNHDLAEIFEEMPNIMNMEWIIDEA
jgi:hypothetical protein